jgi:MFS family permease
MNDGSLAVFVSALPVMRVSLELDFVQIGTILALGLVATMLLQLVFGQLTDQGHARWILILGFAGIVVADLILPVSTVFIQVLVFYVLLRSAAAVYHPVSFSSIGRTYAERTAAFGYQGAIGDLGLTVGTLSTGILAQTWGWRLPFWFWSGVGAILFAYFCTSVFRHKVGFYSQPIQISSQIDDPGNSRSLKAAFVVLAAVSSITTTTFILFTGYMPLYFNIIQGFSPAYSTALVAAWIGIGVFAGFMTGRIVGRLGGEAGTLQATFAIEAILFLIANAVVSYGGSADSWRMIGYAALVLTGIPVFITFPAVNGLLGLRMPHKRLGLTYALNLSLGLMIASLATYLTGYLASLTSAAVIVPALLVVAILGAAASLLL